MNDFWLVVPLFVTTAILLAISGYSLRFRNVPAARPFTIIMFLGAIWASAYALGLILPGETEKLFLLKVRISLQLLLPLAMFATAVEHARLSNRIRLWQRPLFLIIPTLFLIVIWSDQLFDWILHDIRPISSSSSLHFEYGPLIWVVLIHIAIIQIWMLGIFVRVLRNSRGIYFRQTLLLALAFLIPEATYLIFGILRLGPDSYTIAPNSLLLTGLLSAWALFRYQWLSIAPTARSLAINNMNDAMIVLDLDNCIADFNQAATKLFAITEKNIGQNIEKSIPQWNKLPYPTTKEPLQSEFELEQRSETRYFEAIINKIEDRHHLALGHVVILREFTQRRKTDNALKKHIKELEVINAISAHISSQLDMDKLILLIGQQLEEIFNVHSVFVALYDSETRLIKMPYWTINHEHIQAVPVKLGNNLTSIILETRQPLLIAENFQEIAKKLGTTLRFADHFGYPKTWLGVPIIVRDESIGVIGVQDYEQEHAFGEDETRLLQTIATNLGIAMQNANLYQKARNRAEQMSTLYNFGLTLTANLEYNQVLRQLFESCREILPMDAFYVAIYDEATQTISHPLFYENNVEKTVPVRDINVSPGLSGEIIINRRTIYLPDASKRQERKAHQIIRAGGKPSRSYVGAPMTVGGRVVGVLSMQSYEPNAYTQEQIRLLETIANVAGVAIENSRLFEQAQADIEQRRHAQESLQNANQDLHIQLNKVKALERELREQAIRDPLTGLHNRRYLSNVLPQRIDQAEQRDSQLSILMIDIDRFKTFNDSYGHHAGDALLQSLAGLLRRHTRSLDIACRYGGEEFLLVLSNAPLDVASRRAEELREAFDHSENKFGDQLLHATISIGVAAFPMHGTGTEELIMQADQALYAAKSSGRNKVVVWRQ